MTGPRTNAPSVSVLCERCGTMVVRKHLARHQDGERCKQLPITAHCSFCTRPGILAIFDRLRAGDTVDTVAHMLRVSVRHVQDSRTRGRSLGCLPKSTHAERMEEQRVLALQRFGTRECTECPSSFVPRLNTPEQNTCNKRCQEKRKERLKREAAGLPPRPSVARTSPDRLEEEMKPQRLTLEEVGRRAESVRLITGEASHALWFRVLEIRQQDAA